MPAVCALALAGCGASRPTLPASCRSKVVDAVARAAARPTSAVRVVSYVANSGAPSCRYTVEEVGGRMVVVAVSADGAPQAYYRLEREIVEDSQSFTPTRLAPVPTNVPDLGLGASWFPLMSALLTSDGVRLITVTVRWPKATQASEIGLAVAAARPYLGRLHPPP